MMKNQTDSQRGAAHLVLVLAFVVALVGVLGFLGYNAWQNDKDNKTAHASTAINWADKCGSGYALVGKQVKSMATLRIFYNTANRKNCAILVNRLGHKMQMSVKIEGVSPDSGSYSEYAGPVYRTCGGGLATGKIAGPEFAQSFSLRTKACI